MRKHISDIGISKIFVLGINVRFNVLVSMRNIVSVFDVRRTEFVVVWYTCNVLYTSLPCYHLYTAENRGGKQRWNLLHALPYYQPLWLQLERRIVKVDLTPMRRRIVEYYLYYLYFYHLVPHHSYFLCQLCNYEYFYKISIVLSASFT